MGKRSYGISLGVFNLIALLRLRMVNTLPFIYLPVRVARKASDVLAADWSYQTREKIIVILHMSSYGLSHWAGNPY